MNGASSPEVDLASVDVHIQMKDINTPSSVSSEGSARPNDPQQSTPSFERLSFTKQVPCNVYQQLRKHLWDGVTPIFVARGQDNGTCGHR